MQSACDLRVRGFNLTKLENWSERGMKTEENRILFQHNLRNLRYNPYQVLPFYFHYQRNLGY